MNGSEEVCRPIKLYMRDDLGKKFFFFSLYRKWEMNGCLDWYTISK